MQQNNLISEEFEKYIDGLGISDTAKDELAEKLLTAAYFRTINTLTENLPDGHAFAISMLDDPKETMDFLKKHFKSEVIAETVKNSFKEVFEAFIAKKIAR
jgi:hypothetical protein